MRRRTAFFGLTGAETLGNSVAMKPSVAAREAVTKRESEGRSSSPPKPRSSRGGMLPLRPLGASLSYLRKETLRSEGWGEGEGER